MRAQGAAAQYRAMGIAVESFCHDLFGLSGYSPLPDLLHTKLMSMARLVQKSKHHFVIPARAFAPAGSNPQAPHLGQRHAAQARFESHTQREHGRRPLCRQAGRRGITGNGTRLFSPLESCDQSVDNGRGAVRLVDDPALQD
jgi:hypothetical protein